MWVEFALEATGEPLFAVELRIIAGAIPVEDERVVLTLAGHDGAYVVARRQFDYAVPARSEDEAAAGLRPPPSVLARIYLEPLDPVAGGAVRSEALEEPVAPRESPAD